MGLDNCSKLSLKRKRVMIYFVEAAEKLMREEGMEGLSIRKIAEKAGYNSATLYNYFEDLEYLALYASVRYLEEYVVMLAKELKHTKTARDTYKTVYRCFNTFAFREPEIFHNMFFGKYSDKLGEILSVYYYELFPLDLEELSDQMKEMLIMGSMQERDGIIMKDLVREGFVAPEKADYTLELIIALHQSYIYEAMIKKEELNIEAHMKRFNELLEYILDAAK